MSNASAGVQGRYLAAVAGTTLAPSGSAARLYRVVVAKAVATSVITVYNGTSTAGTVIAVIDGNTVHSHDFGGIICNSGIYVDITVAAAECTVVYG